jgi:hypothetical protein
MSAKWQNKGVKRTGHRSKTGAGGTSVSLETALRRAVNSVRRMSQSRRRQSLINAGILTPQGKLSANYR